MYRYNPYETHFFDYLHISQPTITVINDLNQQVTIQFERTPDVWFPGAAHMNVLTGNPVTFTPPPVPIGRQSGLFYIAVFYLWRNPRTGGPTTRECRIRIDYNNQSPNKTYTVTDIITEATTRRTCRP